MASVTTSVTAAVESKITVQPFPREGRRDLGAEVHGVDLDSLTDADFDRLRTALYTHHVLVLKHQGGTSPRAQYELTRRFDPPASTYGHGQTLDTARSVLHPDLKTIPHQPQVQVIGHGFVRAYEGLADVTLAHPHHRKFHKHPLPAARDRECTRFFRWHIDAALYELNPPRVTTLLAVAVPRGAPQTLRYDDGSGDHMRVPLGTTAFASGYAMYDRLSDDEKAFARATRVRYAPHPYVWMAHARAYGNGLRMYSDGLELPRGELPPVDEAKIKTLPMVWRNPVTRKLALQVHPAAAEKLVAAADGSVVEDDLETVREILYKLQRPGIAPDLVYAHDWEEGDLVLFNNHGVIHSVVGSFAEDQVRLFRQCNVAASEEPEGP